MSSTKERNFEAPSATEGSSRAARRARATWRKTWRLAGLAAFALAFPLSQPAEAIKCSTCEDPPPPAPTPAPPSTSQPDAMLQFSQCLPAGVGPFLVDGVRNSMRNALNALDLKDNTPPANPDVRTQCLANGRQTVAIWFAPVGSYGSYDTNAKRNAAIPTISILQGAEQFAVRFRSAGITRMVNVAWADVDKRMNLSGNPDPTGTIRLTNFDVNYYNSTLGSPLTKRVKLQVNGWLDSPFADINFWGWATDYMSVSASGRINCTTATGFDMEDSLEEAAANIFADPETMVAKVLDEGPGCKIVSSMPREVLLPRPPGAPNGVAFKQVFTYQRLTVSSSTGITAGGVHSTVLRAPSASISGPTQVRGDIGDAARAKYRVVTTDMRAPFTVSWSSQNATFSGSPLNTTASWLIPGAANNSQYNRTLHMTVTDADGLVRSSNKVVHVKYVMNSDLPPICDTHPTHYECDPHND